MFLNYTNARNFETNVSINSLALGSLFESLVIQYEIIRNKILSVILYNFNTKTIESEIDL